MSNNTTVITTARNGAVIITWAYLRTKLPKVQPYLMRGMSEADALKQAVADDNYYYPETLHFSLDNGTTWHTPPAGKDIPKLASEYDQEREERR